jgi:hypothetical protein
MDSSITAAARALASGDPLAALQRVALRDDPPALALRGIAMAQLGELARAKQLLARAAAGFGRREELARARCAIASAEIALAARELTRPTRSFDAALRVLENRGDAINALHGRLLSARRLLLFGRVAEAERALARCNPDGAPPMLSAVFELVSAELALRRLRASEAQLAFERAMIAAERARIAALSSEIAHARRALEVPAARVIEAGHETSLRLAEVERVLAAPRLIVDACRHRIIREGRVLSLARRPVLFALARTLAEAWPGEVARAALITRVFAVRRANDSHRARLRVELGRVRALLRPFADVRSTRDGFVLVPNGPHGVAVLAPPVDGEDTALLALLADGAAWSTSALALALGSSQRTVQRALSALEASGRVRSFARARAQRWLAPPVSDFTTTLLLPASFAIG